MSVNITSSGKSKTSGMLYCGAFQILDSVSGKQDPVYVSHFKCNIRRLADYPNLWAYTRDLYQQPGIAQTINMEHIKKSYYGSHSMVNPTGIVPVGPDFHPEAPHERHLLS